MNKKILSAMFIALASLFSYHTSAHALSMAHCALNNICLEFDQPGSALLSWDDSRCFLSANGNYKVTSAASDIVALITVPSGENSVRVPVGGRQLFDGQPVLNYWVTIQAYEVFNPHVSMNSTEVTIKHQLNGSIPETLPDTRCILEEFLRLENNDCEKITFTFKHEARFGSHIRFQYRFDNMRIWTPASFPSFYLAGQTERPGMAFIDPTTNTATIEAIIPPHIRRSARRVHVRYQVGSLSNWKTPNAPERLSFYALPDIWTEEQTFAFNCSVAPQLGPAYGIVTYNPRQNNRGVLLAPPVQVASEFHIQIFRMFNLTPTGFVQLPTPQLVDENFGRRSWGVRNLPQDAILGVRYRFYDSRTGTWSGFSIMNPIYLATNPLF